MCFHHTGMPLVAGFVVGVISPAVSYCLSSWEKSWARSQHSSFSRYFPLVFPSSLSELLCHQLEAISEEVAEVPISLQIEWIGPAGWGCEDAELPELFQMNLETGTVKPFPVFLLCSPAGWVAFSSLNRLSQESVERRGAFGNQTAWV